MGFLAQALNALQTERFQVAYRRLQQIAAPDGFVCWQMGVALSGMSQFEQAIACLQKAEAQLTGIERARCCIDLATVYNRMGKFQQSLPILAEIRPIIEQIGDRQDDLKWQAIHLIALYNRGDSPFFLQHAPVLFETIYKEGTPIDAVVLGVVICYAYLRAGNLQQAHNWIEKLIPIAKSYQLNFRLAMLYLAQTSLSYQASQFEEAAHAITKSLKFVKLTGSSLSLVDSLIVKGTILFGKGNYIKAHDSLNKALQLSIKVNHAAIRSTCLFNLGILDLSWGKYQSALHYFAEAEHWASVNSYSGMLAICQLQIGRIHTFLGNGYFANLKLSEALRDFERTNRHDWAAFTSTLLYQIEDPSQKHIWLARTNSSLAQSQATLYRTQAKIHFAEYLLEANAFSQAESLLRELVHETYPDRTKIEWVRTQLALAEYSIRTQSVATQPALPILQAVELEVGELPEFQLRVMVLRAQHLLQTQQPDLALHYLTQAIQQIRQLRWQANDLVLASMLASRFEPIYRMAISLAYQLNSHIDAIIISEYRRAQWIRTMRQASHAAVVGAMMPPETEAETTQQAAHSQLRADYTRLLMGGVPTNPEQLAALRQKNRQLQDDYARLDAQQMAMPRPDIIRSNNTRPRSLSDYRAAFGRRFGDAWTAIAIEPSAEGWLLLKLTPDTFECQKLQANIIQKKCLSLANAIELDRRRVAYGETDINLRVLAQWLQPETWLPLHSTDHNLILADCTEWSRIAFAAFPLSDGSKLCQRAMLRYTYSWDLAADACADLPTTLPLPTTVPTLAVAPDDFADRYPPLPFTKLEADAFKTTFSQAQVLQGSAANVSALRQMQTSGKLSQFGFIHFASHAVYTQAQPRFSSLALADGDLSTQALLTWQIKGCVSVAACESALAVEYGGEERVGIEAAFMMAGAKACLSTQWVAEDRLTASVMPEIWQYYAQNGDLGLALAQFQRQQVHQPAFRWAGWRVMGMG